MLPAFGKEVDDRYGNEGEGMIKPVEGNITTDFFEPRPLSKPIDERDHVHGAIDIGAPTNTVIRAPEDGFAIAWCAWRKEGQYWPNSPVVNGRPFSFRNYFYDMYGGCVVLGSIDGDRTHIISHSYGNQLFNRAFGPHKKYYIEEKADERFPIHAVYTEKIRIYQGDVVGYVGNAGYSTGPHIHWEIHRGIDWNQHENRINPAEVI